MHGGSLYLAVQTCDSGYDYTFFNDAFEELDGGQLDNPELSMARQSMSCFQMKAGNRQSWKP